MELVFDGVHGVSVFGNIAGEQISYPEKKEEHEADEFHSRADNWCGEEARKAGQGNETVDGVHDHGAEADHETPEKAATRAFVDDGAIDGADWNADEESADESRKSRNH